MKRLLQWLWSPVRRVRHALALMDLLRRVPDLIIWAVRRDGVVLFSIGGGLELRLPAHVDGLDPDLVRGMTEGYLHAPGRLQEWPPEGDRDAVIARFFADPSMHIRWSGPGYDGHNWRNITVGTEDVALTVSMSESDAYHRARRQARRDLEAHEAAVKQRLLEELRGENNA